MYCFQTKNKLSQVLLMNMSKINSKIQILAIKSLLNEKQEQGKLIPLQGENKLYC